MARKGWLLMRYRLCLNCRIYHYKWNRRRFPSPEDPFIPCQVSMRVIIFCNTANEYQRKRAIIYYITNYAMRFGDDRWL